MDVRSDRRSGAIGEKERGINGLGMVWLRNVDGPLLVNRKEDVEQRGADGFAHSLPTYLPSQPKPTQPYPTLPYLLTFLPYLPTYPTYLPTYPLTDLSPDSPAMYLKRRQRRSGKARGRPAGASWWRGPRRFAVVLCCVVLCGDGRGRRESA